MIDTHRHLLPALADGTRNPADALEPTELGPAHVVGLSARAR